MIYADFVLKKPLISTIIIVAVLSIVFFIMSFFIKKVDPMKRTPLWLIPFMMVVQIVNDFVKDTIGKRWKSYSPWFLTLVIFIFFANTSAVYLLDNPTGYLVITFTLAMCSFFVIQATGIVSLGIGGYLHSYIEPNPVMLPMNIISEISAKQI